MSPVDLHAALQQHFNFSTFRPGQQTAIEHVLARRNTLVVMPAGAGKSLIYQLAGLLLPGTALVFSPLIALMKDQIDSLTRRGLAATSINSSFDVQEQARRTRSLTNVARDRIISELSRAVIVIEAGEKSGSLDTAAKAIQQGRCVYAVPGGARGIQPASCGRVE